MPSTHENQQRIGVIFGGQSCEHAVSIASACSILNHLDRQHYIPIPLYVDAQGAWWRFDEKASYVEADFIDPRENAQRCILLPDPAYGLCALPSMERIDCDVLFPIIHGTNGEDGVLQGVLELANIPYVGANVASSAVCMDKTLMKSFFRAHEIPTARAYGVSISEWLEDPQAVIRRSASYMLPLFVKPASLGSSVGISKVTEVGDLQAAIDYAFQFDHKVLIEEGVVPARELELAVLETSDGLSASVAGEIKPPEDFYDYRSKYLDDSAELIFPAPIDDKLLTRMQAIAKQVFTALGVSGMARVDFIVNQKTLEPFVLEVNTLPGFTHISMYPKLWSVSGVSYPELLQALIEAAVRQHQRKAERQTSFDQELEALQQQVQSS